MAETRVSDRYTGPYPSNAWGVLGSFLWQHGMLGAMFLLMAGSMYLNRHDYVATAERVSAEARVERDEWRSAIRESTAVLKDAVGLNKLVADALQRHADESRTDTGELVRVAIADCVNRAANEAERDNCQGIRRGGRR